MNYLDLQKKQQELDDYIIRTKGLDLHPEHLLSNMFSAAIDELMVEVADDMQDPEEWVDVLHFILSIANKYELELFDMEDLISDRGLLGLHVECSRSLLIAHRFSKCFKHWSNKRPNKSMLTTIEMYLSRCVECIRLACIKLGTDMITEYNKKYEINVQRQKEGY